MIKAGQFEEALKVQQQIDNGANIIDINFDESLLDSKKCMQTFFANDFMIFYFCSNND